MATRFRARANARDVVKRAARPALERTARAIAGAIPQHVPVHHGVAVSTYEPRIVSTSDDVVQVGGFGPFWHLLEYGTAHSPAYRPIERAVRSLGVDWQAR